MSKITLSRSKHSKKRGIKFVKIKITAKRCVVAAAGLLAVNHATIAAPTATEMPHLNVNGFFSTGATFTDSTDKYLSNQYSRQPNYHDQSVLGINLQTNVSPEWSLASQTVARGTDSSGDITADWYFATYKPNKWLKFRVGKLILPSWMISEYQDIGYAYPWARPPEEVYSLNWIKAYDGVSASMTWDLGPFEVSPTIFGGSFKNQNIVVASSTTPVEGKDVAGGVLEVTKDNFQFHGTYSKGKFSSGVTSATNSSQLFNINNATATFWSAGVKADYLGFVLLSEYVSLACKASDDDNQSAAAAVAAGSQAVAANPSSAAAQTLYGQAMYYQQLLNAGILTAKAYYATLGYQVGATTPFVTYANLKTADHSGSYGNQKSLSAGARYEFSLNVDAKFQWNRIMTPAGSTGMYQTIATNASGGVDAKTLNVYAFALDYTF